MKKVSGINPLAFDPIFDGVDLDEPFRIRLRMEFATTETEIHQDDLSNAALPLAEELLSTITNKVIKCAQLGSGFKDVYPLVRTYVSERCFGKKVNVEDDSIRSHLRRPDLQDGIAKRLGRMIASQTVEKRAIEFANDAFRLSDTSPFGWRRDLPPYQAKKTVFNYVATFNPFERKFAVFLDTIAGDALRFASLGTTEQGESGTQFKVDYLKPTGAIGFYHPDWVVVQKTDEGEINWIIETKGREWEGTRDKDNAIRDWCRRVSEATGKVWRYARINQLAFESKKPKTLAEALEARAPSDPPSRR